MADFKVPEDVKYLCEKLENSGFETWVVGGCVRDALLGKTPKDWDITTSASFEEIKEVLGKDVYNVPISGAEEHNVFFAIFNDVNYEIASFRTDKEYLDHRHAVTERADSLVQDLSRRDFTINAMAFRPTTGEFVDLFGGQKDIENKVIRAVGDPADRINEDALRILRAYRFACQLGFEIEPALLDVCQDKVNDLQHVSKERKREELTKALLSDFNINDNIKTLTGLVIPDFNKTLSVDQKNPAHIYSLDDHILFAVKNTKKDPILRWAALLHDIGKPQTFTVDDKGVGHFYGHADVSALMSKQILKDLNFPNDFTKRVCELVKYHDRQLNTEKAIKKFLSEHSPELLKEVYEIQIADSLAQAPSLMQERIKTIENSKTILEDILNRNDPLTVKDLKINGNILMDLGYQGKGIGNELNRLLKMVLKNPSINDAEKLKNEAERNLNRERGGAPGGDLFN